MSHREKIIRYYKASGDEDLAGKLYDLAEAAYRGRKFTLSEFVDPYGYSIAETICAHFPPLRLDSNGGYAGSERVRIVFVHEDFPGTIDFGLAALQVSWDDRFYHLTHRDVLGALLGLGLKRELYGDILMNGPACQVVLCDKMKDYVAQHLLTIGAASVGSESIGLEALAAKEEKIKDIRATVASLRLDSVGAAGFGLSRSKMADEIAADKVKVNWQPAKSSSQSIKAGDIISMRGRGRVEVSAIPGQTRKGRTSVLLKRFY